MAGNIEYHTESYVQVPVTFEGKEYLYTLTNLTRLQVSRQGELDRVVIDRGVFGPEGALEQALMSFPGIANITGIHEALFLILFAIDVKRLEQDPSTDVKHSMLERLHRRIPSAYAHLKGLNVQLGNVLHANDRAA